MVKQMFHQILDETHLGKTLFECLFDTFGVHAVDTRVFKIMSCLFYAYHAVKYVRDSPPGSVPCMEVRANFIGSLRAAAHEQALESQEPDLTACMLQDAA